MNCFKCEKDLDLKAGSNISRQEECPHCFQSLHVCKMCVHYDESSYNECREPVADRITEKEKANFCDYFKLGDVKGSGDNKQSALDAANALFKD